MNFKKYHESKNLFDKSTITTGAFVTLTEIRENASYYCSDFIPITATTYYFQNVVGRSIQNSIVVYDASKQGLRYIAIQGSSAVSGAVTFVEGDAYIRINCFYTTDVNTVMVNLGSTPEPYEPYSSEVWHNTPHYIMGTSEDTITTLPAVLYPNGTTATVGLKGNTVQNGTPTPASPVDVQGVGTLDNGQYKIPISSANTTTPVYLGEVQATRKIKKLVLTGEENFSTDTHLRFSIFIGDIKNVTSKTGRSYCSHYECLYHAEPYDNDWNNVYYQNGGTLFFHDRRFDTVSAFKSYLAAQYATGTPVTVWYVLATEETGIVNEPLMKIGDYADTLTTSIPTTDGANTLSVDTTVQPSEVIVNYKGWHPVADVHERNNGAWT